MAQHASSLKMFLDSCMPFWVFLGGLQFVAPGCQFLPKISYADISAFVSLFDGPVLSRPKKRWLVANIPDLFPPAWSPQMGENDHPPKIALLIQV